MATTIPTLSPTELRGRLQELRDLADKIEGAQADMRLKAGELRRSDWATAGGRYVNAISGELRGVYELLDPCAPEAAALDMNCLVERIEDTISVVDMALAWERGVDA